MGEAFQYAYSIPYLIALLYLIGLMFAEFLLIKNQRGTNAVRWGVLVGFMFFFGLRGFIYTDWVIYHPFFEKLPTIWEGGLTSVLSSDFSEQFVTDANVGKAGVEMGFVYFSVLIKSIAPNYFFFVFINTLVDLILLDAFVKRYSKYYVLSFLLFFVFGGLGIEINLMRNVKALMLFLLSIRYITEKRLIPFLLLNGLGFLFHSSAILFFPMYFLLNKTWPKWLVWTLFAVGNVLYIFKIQYLQSAAIGLADLVGGRMGVKVRLYFASDFYNQAYGFGIGYFERVLTFLVVTLFGTKLCEHNPKSRIFINAFYLYFIVYFFFSEILVAVERLSLLFVFSYWILYPELLNYLQKTLQKWMVLCLLLFYSVVKTVQANSNIYARYDNLMWGVQSFEDRKILIENYMDALFKQPK
jgi:hypothetical protein